MRSGDVVGWGSCHDEVRGGRQFGGKQGWAPDSGILFHSTGPDGAFWGTWMESVEAAVEFNGKVVNRGFDVKPRKGRIQLQSEGCAVEFRRITLQGRRR